MNPFEFGTRGRIVFGAGALDRLGELTRSLGATRVLLVTDPGLGAAGIAGRARASLEAAGLAVAVYGEVREDPTGADVAACVAAARSASPDALVAVGGGSSIDTAKGANLVLAGGGRIQDYRGSRTAKGRLLPLVAAPTTAGTGSEVQSYALIADEDSHRKLACSDRANVPAIALLDPALTVSLPARVAAATGVDALVHALECAVTRTRTPASLLFAHQAFRLLIHNLERALASPADLDARGAMLLGACWAGLAIEHSMLGSAHAAANPLSARYGAIHGHAVGVMAPHVMRFNAADPEARGAYGELALAAGLLAADGRALEPIDLADRVAERIRAAGLPASIAEFGATEADIPELARDAATQWTGQHNPRAMTVRDYERVYHAAMC